MGILRFWSTLRAVSRRHAGRSLTVGVLALALSSGGVVWAEEIFLVRPHGETELFDSSKGAYYYPKSGTTSKQLTSNGITFNITYEDVGVGFNDPVSGPEVRGRLEAVLAYVAGVVNVSNRTLDVFVEASEFDGSGALATAGTFYPGSPGFHPGSTLARLQTGVKPFPGFPEIQVKVDKGFQWNIGANSPGPGDADFFSVLLHEMTHGMGIASLVQPDGSSSVGNQVYTIYDQLLFDGVSDQRVLADAGSGPALQTGASSLSNGDIWFDGTSAFTLYGQGTRPPVFAPSPFQQGSSISHWDINRLVGGGVMTHAIVLGSARRQYAFVDIGALIDIGFTAVDPEEAAVNMLAEGLSEFFGTADADSSGGLDLAEAQTQDPAVSQARFDALDTNGDGALTQAELAAQVPGGVGGGNGGGEGEGEGEGEGCLPSAKDRSGGLNAGGDGLLFAGLIGLLAGWNRVRRGRNLR